MPPMPSAAAPDLCADNASQPIPAPTDAAAGRIAWREPSETFLAFSLARLRRSLRTWGMYYFWGKARARQRLYRACRIDGKPMRYTGTGREMWHQFLALAAVFVAMFLLVASVVVYRMIYGAMPSLPSFKIARYIAVVPTVFLLGVMTWRGMVFELERTAWDGHAFRLDPAPWRYGWTHLWTMALIPLTLGWIIPWRNTRLRALMTCETMHRGRRFAFKAGAAALYPRFALAWFGVVGSYLAAMVAIGLTVGQPIVAAQEAGNLRALFDCEILATALPILGCGLLAIALIASWYGAGAANHYASGTSLGGARLRLQLPAGRFARLSITNTIIKLFSLGLLSPVADARAMRFTLAHMSLEGEISPPPAAVSAPL